jgi:multiple sugar transport system substrate-binding protein
MQQGGAKPTSTGTAGGGGGGAKGAITVMSQEGEFSEELQAMWAEDHPELPMTFIAMDETRLNAMLAAGDPPDIVRGLGAQEAAYLAARGIALPLDDYIAGSSLITADDLSPINDVWRWDGQTQGAGPVYGITKDYSLDMMWWYNTQMFEEAGARIPDDATPYTYDELLEVGKSITSIKGGKVERYGLWTMLPTVSFIQSALATADATLFSEDLKTIDFSSPEAQRMIQWFVDGAQGQAGYSVADPNPDGWDWPPFSTERQAMAQAGFWMSGLVTGEEPTQAWSRMAVAPLLGNTRVSPTNSATGHWIPAKAKNPDAGWVFLEWLTAGQPGVDRAKSGWGLPILKSLEKEIPSDLEFQKAAWETQQADAGHAKVIQMSPYAPQVALNAVINDNLLKVVQGGMTVGGFADASNKAANELLAEGVDRVGA